MAVQKTLFDQKPDWKQFLRNRYVLTLTLFLVYTAFFDHYSWFKQRELNNTLSDLQEEKVKFAEAIERAEELQITIAADEEKFAREQYFMKRADEDVYIVE